MPQSPVRLVGRSAGPVQCRIGCALLLCLWGLRADAASTFDPAYRFRTLRTEHFIIHFHQGEDRLAERLAVVAEETWRALERPLGTPPPRQTHVVIVDQSDLFGGYVSLFPRNAIVISAAWPAGSDYLKTVDWLRLVFTHELTHVVHLDRSESWARVVRRVFGRVPLAFPNVFLPIWQIEGLATYEESAITGEGRLHAGDFRAIVTEAARGARLDPIDRVNGGLVDWPGGHAPYAYGLGFHAFLADAYGLETLATLARDTSRRVPYTASLAFGHVYGRSLGDLWRDYEQSLLSSNPPVAAPDAEQLTHHGYVVVGPRFAPARCQTCAAEIHYSIRTPSAFPALYRLVLDGSAPEQLTTRYLGSTTGSGAETIYFDQEERQREPGRYFDLYALDRASGRVVRLTEDARLSDPDVSPDGRTVVAVQSRPGQRNLVIVEVGPATTSATHEITTVVSELDTQFNAPRWSPDGRSIVAERHRPGLQPEIVVVEAGTRAIRVVASDANARWATPTWRRDGGAIVAAADFDEGPFNLYEIDLDGSRVRPLTSTTGGAIWPDVSPDGTAIVYVGYTPDGFDLFRVPYRSAPRDGDVTRAALTVGDSQAVAETKPVADFSLKARDYSPWTTLEPTSWWPTIDSTSTQVRLGATIDGADVLGYHAYSVSASWALSRPEGAPQVSAISPDWRAVYAYARWRPTFYAAASRETSFFGGLPDDDGRPSLTTRQSRQFEAGVILPVVRVRVSQETRVSFLRAGDASMFLDRTVAIDRAAVRLAWSISSAHVYGRSISPERGVRVGVTGEIVRREFGASADANVVSADARAYVPGLAEQHVLAIRASGGMSKGDGDVRHTFLLGGAGPNADVVAFGSDAFSLLRAFGANSFAGTHLALVNADYRWPLARIERGVGTWPFFLRTISAAAGVDLGQAWVSAFVARDIKTSLAAEFSADVVVGYDIPLTVTVGAAWGRDGGHAGSTQGAAYMRVGRAF